MCRFPNKILSEKLAYWTTDTGPILATTKCSFRLPLDYPDRIHIATRASILSPKKFNMEYVVVSERHGAITAEGDGLVVYYDYANGKSRKIPGEVVTAIKRLGLNPGL